MPAESGPSIAPKSDLEILRQRKLQLEQKVQQQVNFSRLAKAWMVQPTEEEDDNDANRNHDKSRKNRGIETTHDVQLVSVISDISCSCSEWEAEDDDYFDDVEDRLGEIERRSSPTQEHYPSIETMLDSFSSRKEGMNDKDATLAIPRGTPTTTTTTSSSSSTLSHGDIECAIPAFSSTPKKAVKVIPLANDGGKGALQTKEAIGQQQQEESDILKKNQPQSEISDNSTTITGDGDSSVSVGMKCPLISVVVFLGLLVVVLVVAVLVLTVLILCHPKNNQSTTTDAAAAAAASIISLAPSPSPVFVSSMPDLQPTST